MITPDKYEKGLIGKLPIQARKVGNQKTLVRRQYKDVICAFDIETTRIKSIEQSVMYVWMFHIHHHCTIVGRTWEELKTLLDTIASELLEDETLVVYVHNLSYEFQFLQAIINWRNEDIFAIDRRKVLKSTSHDGHIEYRCSYLHSNMSLAVYTDKFNVEHKKLDGKEFNYDKVRYPWTPLTDRELEYCVNDVIGLCETLEKEMLIDDDNLYTIPLTSTGYVRRDAKRSMRKTHHSFVKEQLPDMDIYEMCREAFRGGNTHANRFYANRIIKDVKSADRSSSYPEVLCNCKFPVTKFQRFGPMSISQYIRFAKKRKKALLMRIKLFGISLLDDLWGCPYISRDKARNIDGGLYDNGRVLSAKYLELTVTDIDMDIILSEYKFDKLVIYDSAYARYGKLPQSLIDVVIDYYKKKTELKNVEGMELLYMKSKNKLNSIYGMMAQNPVKIPVIFDKDDPNVDWKDDENADKLELLLKSNCKAFLAYQWGVWTTAHARYALEEGLRIAGDNMVYCDTDSVKYIGDCDFTEYNKGRTEASIESGAYAKDKQGVTHYMGVYEDDGYYAEFSTLGAKKYAYRKKHEGETFVTIAGVTKRSGGKELDKHGGLEAFKEGFTFVESGGTESVWNDRPTNGIIEIDGHQIEITPNVVIRPSTYTLGLTAEYKSILETSHLPLDFWTVL